MFFSEDLLTSKKGTFGIIWLAATLGPRSKRITRRDLTNIDLSRTCELIAEPPEPMALRLSGCLLVGVARVYNQNYEIFYADVNQFHTTLRRSIATDFATAAGVPMAGGGGVDIAGDGKSRFDAITFTGVDLTRQTGLDFSFDFVDWRDPLGKRKRRRASTKLDSLPSQQTEENPSEGETDSEESDEESEIEGRRDKRHKISSSPLIGSLQNTTRQRTSTYVRKDPLEGMDNDFAFSDEPIDLDLFNEPGDISFSAPSGRGIELEDQQVLDGVFDEQVLNPVTDDIESRGSHTHRKVTKKRPTLTGSNGSLSEIEDDLEEDPRKKLKPRKKRMVTYDQSLEMSDELAGRQGYIAHMKEYTRIDREKERARTVATHATALVDGAGQWLQFFDEEVQAIFSTLSHARPFKWEQDLTAHRAGGKGVNPHQEDIHLPDERVLEDPNVLAEDTMDDFNIEHAGEGMPNAPLDAGRGSDYGDLELPRRASQRSQQGPLPWQDRAFDSEGDAFFGVGGPDSSFTPGSLRLSIMTPQELRIRMKSQHGSSSGLMGSFGQGHRRSRSLTGSLLGRNDREPQMLIGDDDLDLPINEYDLDITASQADKRTDIPEAFKPELLATLEKQCRDFLSFLEQTVVSSSEEELHLEDLLPNPASKRVAAAAFYNCLTLGTKRILDLDQPDYWGPIHIRLAV